MKYLTITEAAKELEITRQAVHEAIKSKSLKAHKQKKSGIWLISEAEVKKRINSPL